MNRRLIGLMLAAVVALWPQAAGSAAPAAPVPAPPPPPTALPSAFSVEEVTAFYAYDDSVPLDAVRKSLDSATWYDQYDVEYRSLGETVYARFVVPKSDKAVPCIVGVHGMFSDNIYQFWTAADFAAKRGFAVIVPSLPYHHKRTQGRPLIPGQQLIVGPPEVVKGNLRRAVVDVRRTVDYVSGLPEIDSRSISVAGISLGGTLATLAFKVDPRFAKGVAVVGGSGVGGILENGRIDVLNMFRAAARAGLVNPQEYVDALKIVDPINLPDPSPRPALLLNGTSDIIMVADNAVRLRESLALAKQVWTNGSHYFPLYPAVYLLMDFLLDHGPAHVSIGGGVSFSFAEQVRPPVVGADNLWVDLRVTGGNLAADHRLSVPNVNRSMPMLVVSKANYAALESALANRHLPAFVYVTGGDSALELDAALAYAQILGVSADPAVYYVASQPAGGGGEADAARRYSVGTLSPMAVSRARNTVESAMRFPGASPAAADRLPVPLSIFDRISLVDGPSGLEGWLAGRLSTEILEPIQWFLDYPCDNPRWVEGP